MKMKKQKSASPQINTPSAPGAISRSDFIKTAAMASLTLSVFPHIYCKATGAKKIRIGFIPLTDCASVVMAHELGLYKKYGLDVEVSKEASWPNIRDKLLNGELTAAHCLFGMPFSVYMGIGGPAGSLARRIIAQGYAQARGRDSLRQGGAQTDVDGGHGSVSRFAARMVVHRAQQLRLQVPL